MPEPKTNILVAFYSRDGSVEKLAKAVSEGARENGAEVRLRRVADIVSPAVMAKVPGWEERSKRMLAEYGAPFRRPVSLRSASRERASFRNYNGRKGAIRAASLCCNARS
jgi:hypothetical protein